MKPFFNQIILPIGIFSFIIILHSCELNPEIRRPDRDEKRKKHTEISQSHFLKSYTIDSVRTYTFEMKQTEHKGWILAGTSNVDNYTYLNVLSLDSMGQLDWNFNYDLEGGYLAPKFIQITSNHEILISGYFTNIGLDDERWFFLRLDDEGNVISIKCYKINGGSSGSGFIQLKNDEFLLTSALMNPYAFLIARFSMDGNLISAKKMEKTPEIVGSGLIQKQNGEIWLAGHHKLKRDSFFRQNFFILKLNENAEIMEQKSYGLPAHIAYVRTLDTKNNRLLVHGKIGDTSVNPYLYKHFLAEFDENGTPLWSKSYDSSTRIRKAFYLPDGRIISGSSNTSSKRGDICFQYLNSEGIPQAAYHIESENRESIGDFSVSNEDNALTFSGSSDNWSRSAHTRGLIVGRVDLSFTKPATPFIENFATLSEYENIELETGTIDIVLTDFELKQVPIHPVRIKKAEPEIVNLEDNRVRN